MVNLMPKSRVMRVQGRTRMRLAEIATKAEMTKGMAQGARERIQVTLRCL